MRELDNPSNELLTVHHPYRCVTASCKCCCYQEMVVTSGQRTLGTITEDCWYCVPSFGVRTPDEELYKMHPPTCCCGTCINCCNDDCCTRGGCCKVPFHVFPTSQYDTDLSYYTGKILKKRKSVVAECCTQESAFDINFPHRSTPEQKGLLIGAAILLNSTFFQGKEDDYA